MEEETAWTTKRQIGGTYLKKQIMSLDRQLPPKVHHDVVPTHTSRLQFERLRYPHKSYPAQTPDPRGAWGWRRLDFLGQLFRRLARAWPSWLDTGLLRGSLRASGCK